MHQRLQYRKAGDDIMAGQEMFKAGSSMEGKSISEIIHGDFKNFTVDNQKVGIGQVSTIGDYCFIGPGAKIFGKCKLGNNVRVGTNAIVNKDVQDDQTVYGIPQKNTPNKRNIITIADERTEELFLKKYPQYIDIIKTL